MVVGRERKADGHVVVIGHHSQQEVIQQGQFQEEEHLHEAPSGDGAVLCVDVEAAPLGDDGAGEAGVRRTQVVEEVHGGYGGGGQELMARDDEQVPQHGDQAHGQEEPNR